jgi:uncharacterized membrane protein
VTKLLRAIENDQEDGDENFESPRWFFLLFAAGFIVILVGILFLILATLSSDGSSSAGVIIFIGPFPIVLGVGPDAWWLISIGIALAAISIIVFVILRRRL